jgi:hypothetical protein
LRSSKARLRRGFWTHMTFLASGYVLRSLPGDVSASEM